MAEHRGGGKDVLLASRLLFPVGEVQLQIRIGELGWQGLRMGSVCSLGAGWVFGVGVKGGEGMAQTSAAASSPARGVSAADPARAGEGEAWAGAAAREFDSQSNGR